MLKSIIATLKQYLFLNLKMSVSINDGKHGKPSHMAHSRKEYSRKEYSHMANETCLNLQSGLLLSATILSVILLTGCGQSGDLYYVEEAPSNTEFIIYENPNVKDKSTTQDAESIKNAAEQNPEDY